MRETGVHLEEFVSSVLLEIAAGVRKANQGLGQGQSSPTRYFSVGGLGPEKVPSSVDFDIAVTARSGSETAGKAGAQLWVAEVAAGGKASRSDERVSRVKFSVAVTPSLT